MPITMELDEGERQMLLMALAHLAVERRGWDDALERLALQIDNRSVDGEHAVMFNEFKRLHRMALAKSNPSE